MKKDCISGFPVVTFDVFFAESQEGVETNIESVFGFWVVEGVSAFVLVDFDSGVWRSNAREMLAQQLIRRHSRLSVKESRAKRLDNSILISLMSNWAR